MATNAQHGRSEPAQQIKDETESRVANLTSNDKDAMPEKLSGASSEVGVARDFIPDYLSNLTNPEPATMNSTVKSQQKVYQGQFLVATLGDPAPRNCSTKRSCPESGTLSPSTSQIQRLYRQAQGTQGRLQSPAASTGARQLLAWAVER
jgi:hypothetical protein